LALLASVVVLLAAQRVVTTGPRAAAGSLAWQKGAHIPGVFDVIGPRTDGRLVVAATGGLYLLDASGQSTRFVPGYSPRTGTESYIAVSPGLEDGNGACSFAPDAVAALDLASRPPGVTLISPQGAVSHLASIAGVTGLFGITFDTVGRFGHRILVIGEVPGGHTQISAVDCLGHVTSPSGTPVSTARPERSG
jgi:hypothetical protein